MNRMKGTKYKLLVGVLIFAQLLMSWTWVGLPSADAASPYVWKKYNVGQVQKYRLSPVGGNDYQPYYRTFDGYTAVNLNPDTGSVTYSGQYLTISGYGAPPDSNGNPSAQYVFKQSGSYYYQYTNDYGQQGGSGSSWGPRSFIYQSVLEPYNTAGPGSLVGTVSSPYSGTYPNNGQAGDGFWYVYVGQNAQPTFSVDQTNRTVNRKAGNTSLVLSGTLSDPDNDQVTVSATVSGVTRSVKLLSGTWQLIWSIDDIPAGTYTNIPISYTDGVSGAFSSTYTGTATVDKRALAYYDKYTTIQKKSYYDVRQSVTRSVSYTDQARAWYPSYSIDPNTGYYYGTGSPHYGNYQDRGGNTFTIFDSQTLWEFAGSGSFEYFVYEHLPYYTMVDAKGTLTQSNILEFDGTYPADGKYSDGFWYVRKTTSNRFPTITLNNSGLLFSKVDTSLNIAGTVTDPDKDVVDVSATIAGVTKTVSVDTNATSTFNLRWNANELTDGEYPSLTVTVDDRKGGSASAIHTSRILVDRVSPTDPVISLSTPDEWTASDVTVTVEEGYDLNPSLNQYRLSTTALAPYTGPVTYSAEGSYTFITQTTDVVGNSSYASKTFGIVKTPPTKPAITVTKLGWTSEDVGFSLSGSTSIAPLTYEYSINGGAFKEGSSGTVNTAGVTTIVARAKDAAGNLSDESTTTVQIDRTNPEIAAVPNGSDWGAAAVPVKVTASDAESGVNAVQYAITESKDAPESWAVLPDDGSVEVANEGVWYLHVKAVDKAGNTSLFVSSPYQIQNPPVPVDPGFLTATALSSSEVQLKWGGPASALKDGFEYTIQNETTGKTYTASYPTLTVTDNSAAAGTSNAYKLTIKNHTGTQETSASALTYPDAPTKVTSQVESLSGTDMNIAWDAVTGADSYRVVVRASNGGGVVQDLSVSDLQTVVSGLTPGTAYTVYVSGVNTTGEGTSATLAFLTLPAEPGDFMSVLIQETAVDLSWSPVPSATDYRLYRDDTEVASVTDVTYGDRDLESGTSYQYEVAAINETGEGDKSAPLSVLTLPAKDSSLNLTGVTADSLTAEWAGVKGAEGYTVELLKDATVVDTQTVDGNSHTFTSLEPGTGYTVRLTPYNTSGAGASSQKSTTTIPPKMTTDILPEIGQTGVTFTYGSVQGATQYKFTVDGVETVSTTSPAVLSGLKGSTEYDVEVRAGNEQGFGEPTRVHILTKPAAPSNLTIKGDSETGLTVSWDKDGTATSYTVVILGLVNEETADNTIKLTGLEPGLEYTVEVFATNPTGVGTVASAVSMTLPAAPVLGDVIPSFNESDVTWGAVTGAVAYEIGTEDAVYYSGVEAGAKLVNLEDGHTYKLNLYAINAIGGRSKPLSFTFTTKVAAVSGVSVDEITESALHITIPATDKVVDHFVIKRNGEELAKVENDGKGYSDDKLDANTDYAYEIIPVNASGEGTPITRFVKTPSLAVNKDTVKVEAGTDKVTISFDPVEGAEDYVLYEDGKEIWRGNTSPIELNGLLPGSAHDYVLQVDNGSGTLSKPIQIPFLLLPGKPEGITVTTTDSSATFTLPGLNESDLSYVVVVNGKEVGKIDAGVTTYKVAPLKSSTDYTFEVFAVNKTGRSELPLVLKVKTKDAPPVPVYVPDSSPVNTDPKDPPKQDTDKDTGKGDTGSGDNTSNTPVTTQFTDTTSSFAREEINYLAAAGVVKGVSSTSFEPARTVTRMEFAAMLVRAKKEPLAVAVNLPYQDIRQSAWYIDELKTAVSSGIADGFSVTRFGPDLEINREQATKMVINAAYGKDFVRDNAALLLADTDVVASWALPSVEKAVTSGLVLGFPDGTFKPKANITRAEAAMLIYRMLTKDAQ